MTGQRGHEPLTCRNLRQIPLQKAVALRHVNVFTAGFLCFRRFPAASLQLGILVRTRNHFPGLYCGNAHSLRPRKTTFSINLDQGGCHLQWKDSGRAYANPKLNRNSRLKIKVLKINSQLSLKVDLVSGKNSRTIKSKLIKYIFKEIKKSFRRLKNRMKNKYTKHHWRLNIKFP